MKLKQLSRIYLQTFIASAIGCNMIRGFKIEFTIDSMSILLSCWASMLWLCLAIRTVTNNDN